MARHPSSDSSSSSSVFSSPSSSAPIGGSSVLKGGRGATASVGAAAAPLSAPWVAAPRPSAWAVARTLVAARGVRGLYSGLAPSLARAFVVSGSRFSAFEAARWALTETRPCEAR
jgi:hypothetical protein